MYRTAMLPFRWPTVLVNVRFGYNTADIDGGGLYNDAPNLTPTDVTFTGNQPNDCTGCD